MLKTFVGFKGTAAMVEIGKIKFVILARNTHQLEILWASILSEAGPLDPSKCKPSIMVEARLLPDQKPKPISEPQRGPTDTTIDV